MLCHECYVMHLSHNLYVVVQFCWSEVH